MSLLLGAMLSAACAGNSANAKPDAAPGKTDAAKETPAERLRRDALRQQKEEEERRTRDDFIHRQQR
jgi:hypothetical protein